MSSGGEDATAGRSRVRRPWMVPAVLLLLFFSLVAVRCVPETFRAGRTLAQVPPHAMVVDMACQHLDLVEPGDASTYFHIDKAADYLRVAAAEAPKWTPTRDRVNAVRDAKESPELATYLETARAGCDAGLPEWAVRPALPADER